MIALHLLTVIMESVMWLDFFAVVAGAAVAALECEKFELAAVTTDMSPLSRLGRLGIFLSPVAPTASCLGKMLLG